MEEPFEYQVPRERIAQRPVEPYDQARLLVVRRGGSCLTEAVFSDLTDYLDKQDLLILNNTRVIPARLNGKLASTEREVELLLVRQVEDDIWLCLGKPLRRLKPGQRVLLAGGLEAEIGERAGSREILVKFSKQGQVSVEQSLLEVGSMPIPPYIRGGQADELDRRDYQSCFAEESGSIAAPTASLHFTPKLLGRIKEKGCGVAYLTLHVGTASFLPIYGDGVGGDLIAPAAERYRFPKSLSEEISERKAAGGRVIAVGTTVVRALESIAATPAAECSDAYVETDLFIRPGYAFGLVDAVVTNFHWPGSTHLLLVQALMGRELLEASYQYALDHEFRFFSYGDGMLIC
jgi:S-adenosylmethionine:tRNA ribosyltransferase-isomerase